MTKLYFYDFGSVQNFEKYFSYLDENEISLALQKKNALVRKQYVFSRLLLKHALSENGFEFGNIIKTEKGKPYFESGFPFFSISHSDTAVVVAVSNKEVGCDIQIKKGICDSVSERYFEENEKSDVLKNGLDFINLWSIKESIFKYDGSGIPLNPKDTMIEIEKGEIKVKGRKNLIIKDFSSEKYCIHVCCEEECFFVKK